MRRERKKRRNGASFVGGGERKTPNADFSALFSTIRKVKRNPDKLEKEGGRGKESYAVQFVKGGFLPQKERLIRHVCGWWTYARGGGSKEPSTG